MLQLRPFAFAAATTAVVAFAPAAMAAAPAAFTMVGTATSTQDGKTVQVPNTLYYQHGHIRLEMARPVETESTAAFSVVLAQEGGKTITLLNPEQKQAMKLQAGSLEEVTDNPSLQKISNFRLSEFGATFRAKGKKIGAETVAGQACSIYDHVGKDGHFRLSISDKYDLPMRFAYYEGSRQAFSYVVNQFAPAANLPASSFTVPGGYQMTDISDILKGLDTSHH